ncbi:Hypothetical predicted protein [Podarcis lilfordi]|uniref:Uncharacterized protein n=1 Tax=Podarcis lilfordi TaxID=74358 RepID=A0AA35P4S2_9SAUR|nr:Hypothetical predicted protein [Podarcis lilfordi]
MGVWSAPTTFVCMPKMGQRSLQAWGLEREASLVIPDTGQRWRHAANDSSLGTPPGAHVSVTLPVSRLKPGCPPTIPSDPQWTHGTTIFHFICTYEERHKTEQSQTSDISNQVTIIAL